MQYICFKSPAKNIYIFVLHKCLQKESLLCDEGLIGVFVLNSMQLMERVIVTGFEKPSTVPSL